MATQLDGLVTTINQFMGELEVMKAEVEAHKTKLIGKLKLLEEAKGLAPAEARRISPAM